MVHPFLRKKEGIIYYWVAWSVVMLLHASLIYYFLNFDIYISVTDSLISNILFALFGLSIWFPVNYINTNQKFSFTILIGHLLASTIYLLIWFWISKTLLSWFAKDNTEYFSFLSETQLYRIIIGAFLYALLLLIYFIIKYYDNLKNKIKQETELKTYLKEVELNYQKAQINPHFLFNSLNSISFLTITEPEKAHEMIIKLSDFLRYSLKQKSNELTILSKEVENIKRYMEIEKIRFGERLVMEINLNKDCKNLKIPNMILQPLYENAIKHGIQSSTEKITISTNCSVKNNHLIISIKNNFDEEGITKKGTGLGIQNIKTRLQLIYKKDNLFEIKKENNIFTVKLYIPQTLKTE